MKFFKKLSILVMSLGMVLNSVICSNLCYASKNETPYGVYCKMLVDLDCIQKNLKSIKEKIGLNVHLMPVVKGKAYGTYATEVISTFTECGIDMLAVAKSSEGMELRKLGFTGEIVVLSQPFVKEINDIIEYNLTPGVCYLEFLKQLEENLKIQNKELSVHLEIETGLGRTGIEPKDLTEFTEFLKNCHHVKVNGAYTHFASADSDENYTNKQINIFEEAVKNLKQHFEIKYIHMSSSTGVINVPTGICNVVRPGLLVYGYLPDESMEGKIELYPCAKLVSKISFIHKLKKGESCNYDQCFTAKRDTVVGVLPIGYSTGVPRCFTGEVVINKTRVPILGRVNMDNIMVDLTDFPEVAVGQEVYFWDNEIIKLSEYASSSKAVCEGALSVLSAQIPRIFSSPSKLTVKTLDKTKSSIPEFNVEECTVSNDKSLIQIERVKEMLRSTDFGVDWSDERFQKIIENSLCYGLYTKEGRQIGFVKAVTDFELVCYVSAL